jgi:hypothetical protein
MTTRAGKGLLQGEVVQMAGDSVTRPRLRLLTTSVGPSDHRGPIPDALLAIALSMMIFYPVLMARLHASMTPLILLLFLIWTNGFLERRKRTIPAGQVIALVITYAIFLALLTRLVARTVGFTAATTLEHVFLLFPLATAAGWILVRSGRIVQYLSWLLIVGLITVLPAVYEYLTNTAVIRAAAVRRNGSTRAIVGSETPLVLGALFLALIPIAVYLTGRYRYVCSICLYIGVLTTGSNGPEILGAVVLMVCLIPFLARRVLSTWRPLTALLTGIAVYLFVGANWLWTTQISGESTTDVSNQYRAALYAILPRLFHDRPFGYGLAGLPPDTIYFSTASSGIQDVSRSVDSEFVYSVTQFGYIGALVFVVIAVFGVFGAMRNHAIGLSSLATTLVGLFLSIHSWNSLGTLWFLLFGACAALVLVRGGSVEWTGLYSARPKNVPQWPQVGVAAEAAMVTPAQGGGRGDPGRTPISRQPMGRS